MISVPPDASAMRRAMSRPRPVEPPLDWPREGRVGRTEAGSVVGDHQPCASRRAPAEPHGEAGALGGMREHVSQQDVRAGRQVIRGHEDRYGAGSHVDDHPAVLVFGERPPERGPFGDDPGRVAQHRGAPTRPSLAAAPPG